MTYEIGSHFELDGQTELKHQKSIDWLPNLGDAAFTFSGRSAIELALMDIKQYKDIKSVYMPSYCCYSMIEPFVNNGISIEFYEVSFLENQGLVYDIDTNKDCDIFFAMSYFGLENFKLDNHIETFFEQGKIIIEDITHRLLSNSSFSDKADYCIASIRKWFPVATGGYITKKNGSIYKKPTLSSEHFVKQKINAMYSKKKYLEGYSVSKERFLQKFNEYELKLKEINYNYAIDNFSLKVLANLKLEDVRIRRRRNAEILYEGLKKFSKIIPLIPSPDLNKETPLFVPIMVIDGKRDDLRRELIQNNIYCPVHWPQEKNMKSEIPNYELSLICDQRYSERDMEFILEIINKWYMKKLN